MIERLTWVDRAKGLTIVLVVMWHVVGKHYLELEWKVDLPVRGVWRELNEFFIPMRMPLFLLLSGLLASNRLQRDWDAIFRIRVANPYALYVMWFSINALALAAFGFAEAENLNVTVSGLLQNLVLPHTTLWYMFALVVYFLAAFALRPLGTAIPLILATIVASVMYSGILHLPEGAGMLESILRYFILFLVGALLPGLPRRVAEYRGVVPLSLGAAIYSLVYLGFRNDATTVPGFGPLGTIIGALVGVLIAVHFGALRRVAHLMEWIGRNTLAIFVLHIPLLAGVHWATTARSQDNRAFLYESDLFAAVYPLLLTTALVGSSLVIQSACKRWGLGWLFVLPFGRTTRSTNAQRPVLARGHGRRPVRTSVQAKTTYRLPMGNETPDSTTS